MRVLAWPLYTYAGKPAADSGYICFRNLIRAVPEWDWQVVVPEWAHEKGLLEDDLDDLPNVEKVPVDLPTLHRVQEVTPSPETVWRYAPQAGLNPVDAVITGSNQIAHALSNAWGIRMPESHRPVIVAWDLMTRDDQNRGWRADEVELLAHFTGAATADLNIYGSEMMRWMTQNMLRKQFSPAVIRDVMQNRSETLYAGVPTKRIAEVTKGIKKRDKFTVFYGGRMGSVKRVDELTEITDIAFSFGREMEMVVCTGSLGPFRRKGFEEKFPMVELHIGTNQEETWRLMAECHAGFMWSRHEMIGSMFIEEMAHGLPVIAHPHRWIEALLPEEYPYWANDAREAGAQLRLLYDAWKADPDGYDKPMGEWSEYVRSRYDSDKAGEEFRKIVTARVEKQRGPLIKEMREDDTIVTLTREVIREGMTFPDLIEGIKSSAQKRSVIGNALQHARSNPMIKAYYAAQHLGWQTSGPGEGFTFTKKEQTDD